MTKELISYRVIATIALIGLIFAQFVFVYNMFKSRKSGPQAPANPWKSNSLEWAAPSPPPHGNFEKYPTVYRGPYEFSVPGRSEDYWPQHIEG